MALILGDEATVLCRKPTFALTNMTLIRGISARGLDYMLKSSGDVEIEHPRAALIVAHPPHVLTLYGWMRKVRPLVHVLTDGQCLHDPSAYKAIAQTMHDCGATRGEIFYSTTESLYFRALLDGDLQFFVTIAQALTDSLIRHNITFVVADAEEGDNSLHDICRALADAAVEAARRATGRKISSYACYQTEWMKPDRQRPDDSWLQYQLEPDIFVQKLAAASHFTAWSGAIAEAVEGLGQETFRSERLAPVRDHALPTYTSQPFYETHGERRAASGKYASVIRYQEHVVPVWKALRDYANETR